MRIFEVSIDWQILAALTDEKSPASYIFFASIGLYSSIAFVIIEEKRMPNRYDFIKLVGFIPFVWGFALLLPSLHLPASQLVSFLIGIAPEPAFKYMKKKATKYFDEKDEKEDTLELAKPEIKKEV